VLGALVPATAAQAAEVTISGLVTGTSGAASSIKVGWFSPTSASSDSVYTDETGHYSLDIPTDVSNYYLTVNLEQDGLSAYTGTSDYNGEYIGANGKRDFLFQTLAPYTTPASADVNIALTKPGKIVGTAKAFAKSWISITDLGGNYISNVQVASNGTYSSEALIPGRYRVVSPSYDLNGYLPWESATVVVGANKTMTVNVNAAKGAVLKGVVKGAGKALKSIGVSASTADYSGYGYDVTDSKGAYSLEGLTSGKYSVSFYANGTGASVASYITKTVNVSGVKAGTTKTVNVTLVKGGSVSGTVKLSSGAKDYRVSVVNSKKVIVGGFSGTPKAKFTVGGLPTGKYTLYITDSKGTKYGTKSVSVKAGKTTKAGKVAVTKKTVTLSGVVSGGKNGFVSLYSSALPSAYADVSSKGAYKVQVIPGKYEVVVSANGYAEKTSTLTIKKSTKKNLSVGAAWGKVTARLQIGNVDVEDASVEFRKDDGLRDNSDIEDGMLSGSFPAGTYSLANLEVYDVPLQYGAPFYYDIPSAKKKFTLKSGKTTNLGTFNLELKR